MYVQYPNPRSNAGPSVTIAPTSDLTTALLSALGELAETGGTIWLTAGAYTIPDQEDNFSAVRWTQSNITLRGAGNSTVITSELANNQWVIQIISPSAVTPRDINNTTASGTSITTATASWAGDVTAGDPIMVHGTDGNGVIHVEAHIAASNGNPSTGVIALVSPLTYSLTSAKFRYYTEAKNNTLRDFKIVHNSPVTAHSFGLMYSYRTTFQNITGDGGGAVTGSMNFISIGGNLYPKMNNCVVYDYNTVEHYLGTDGCKGAEWSDVNYGGEFNGNSFDSNGSDELATADNWQIGGPQESCTFNNNVLTNDGNIVDYHIYIGSTSHLTNCTFDGNTFENSIRQLVYAANSGTFMNCSFNGNTFDTVQTPTFPPGFQIINPAYDSGLELVGNTFVNIPADAANWSVVHSPTVSGNTVTNCGGPIYINNVPV